MTQYHEGQKVEVLGGWSWSDSTWRKAEIIQRDMINPGPDAYIIEFPDSTRALVYADHIRAWPTEPFPPEEQAESDRMREYEAIQEEDNDPLS
jgi:hypothetical protein